MGDLLQMIVMIGIIGIIARQMRRADRKVWPDD